MKIKIGILGLANIAEKYIINTIKSLDTKFDLVGIASTNKSNISKIEIDYKSKFYSDYNDLLKQKIDAVYIPLPNSLHYKWTKIALEQKINVIVEKPMTLNSKQCKELYKLAYKNNVVLLENFQFRFHRQLDFIKSLILSNKIGKVKKVNSNFCFNLTDKNNIRYKKSLGGGSLFDTGVYPIKVVQLLFGNNLMLDYSKLNFDNINKIDLSGHIVLKEKTNNITCNLSFGFENFYQCSLEILGDKGRIFTNRIFTCPPDVQPEIEFYFDNQYEKHIIPFDNHFINIFNYFFKMISERQGLDIEMSNNITFYNLLDQIIKNNKL